MNRVRTRRTLATLASVILGLLGAVALPGTASAQEPIPSADLSGECHWDSTASQWAVVWTITAPTGAGDYRLDHVEFTPDGSTLTGIAATADPGSYPHPADQPLVGHQVIPADATTATVTVFAGWAEPAGTTASGLWSGTLALPSDCAAPDLPDLVSGYSFDCRWLSITIKNPLGDTVRLTLVPAGGDPLDVELADGESATVQFPATSGNSVDIRFDGRSIVDPGDPIIVTEADWAALDCGETGAEGADLAVTGAPITLVVGGALVLLTLGGGLYLIARRRRVRFTT